MGDSMIYGIDETKMSKSNQVKVHCLRGAYIDDIKRSVQPILKRNPKGIILHVGTNDCTISTANSIFENLKALVNDNKTSYPQYNVVISNVITRTNNENARKVSVCLNEKIFHSNLDYIDNGNISIEHLGRKGLHLNPTGVGKLAVNLIKKVRSISKPYKRNN